MGRQLWKRVYQIVNGIANGSSVMLGREAILQRLKVDM
jgi:hypothetical protein